jgi:hypothetical protein
MGMERAGVIKIERQAMRLMGQRSAYVARPSGHLADQRHLAGIMSSADRRRPVLRRGYRKTAWAAWRMTERLRAWAYWTYHRVVARLFGGLDPSKSGKYRSCGNIRNRTTSYRHRRAGP